MWTLHKQFGKLNNLFVVIDNDKSQKLLANYFPVIFSLLMS